MLPWLLMQTQGESLVSSSASIPWESLGFSTVTSSLEAPWEGNGYVTSPAASSYEALMGIESEPTIPWESTAAGAVVVTSGDVVLNWEAEVSRSVDYEVEAKIWRDIEITVEV